MRGALTIGLIAIVAISVSSMCVAQSARLSGRSGVRSDYNVTWLDLSEVTSFRAGQRLQISFIPPSPRSIILRFVTTECDYSQTCEIPDCTPINVARNTASVILKAPVENVKQISLHSGNGEFAYHCTVNGGPISLVSEIRVR